MSDNGKKIIALPIVDYTTIRQRPQQLLSRFAKHGYTVLHVSPHVASRNLSVETTEDEGVSRVVLSHSPYQSFLHSKDSSMKIEVIAFEIEKIAYPHSPVLWINSPYWFEVAARLKEKMDVVVVYDVLDNFIHFEDLRPHVEKLTVWHKSLVEISDHVFYTASYFSEVMPEIFNRPVTYLPNACEPEVWESNVLEKPTEVIVGYFGCIASWFDVDLVNRIAAESSFFVDVLGPKSSKDEFAVLDNLRVHPKQVEHKVLAESASRWRCGIIPFLKIPLTDCTDPVKLYEYMAAGLPVVATELEELKLLSASMPKHIRPSLIPFGYPEYFKGAILKEIATDDEHKRKDRKKWASEHTWDIRAATALEVLGGLR